MLPVIDCGFFHQLPCDAGLHGQALLYIPVPSARASSSSVMQSTSQRNFSARHRTANLPRDSATFYNSAGNFSKGANRSREILYVDTVSGNFRPECEAAKSSSAFSTESMISAVSIHFNLMLTTVWTLGELVRFAT